MNSKIIKKSFSSLQTKMNIRSAISPVYKLLNDLPYRDSLLVSSQNTKWTISELNTYTDAFARSLIENGLEPGQKFLIWSDINHSAEILCASLGALKAGLTVVHSEFENSDEIKAILKKDKIDALLFSPFNTLEKETRVDSLIKDSDLVLPKHVIQISHKTLPNMIKFKQAFNYSSGFNTNIDLPEISENLNAFEIIRPGNSKVEMSHNEVYDKITSFNHGFNYGISVNSAPCFYPVSLSIGLLGNLVNKNYVVFPGTYSLKEILKTVKLQKAKQFICEGNLLDMKADSKRTAEIAAQSGSVESLLIFGEKDVKNKDSSNLQSCFPNAKLEYVDEFNFTRI